MKVFTVLTVVASLAATLDARNLNPLLDGGSETGQHEYPFVAGIWAKDGNDPVLKCAGIIVSEKVVITSAKCVHKPDDTLYDIADIIVIAGDHDTSANDNDDEVVYQVASIVVRGERDADKNQNDIAAITLTEDLDTSKDGIAVASFPGSDEDVAEGKPGKAVGWLEEQQGNPPAVNDKASKLQQVELTIKPEADCKTKYGDDSVSADNFCGGATSDSTGVLCNGDEGSPFIVDGENNAKIVVGFASNIKDCDNTGAGALFTKLAPHNDWIQEQINPDSTPEPTTTTEKDEGDPTTTTEKDEGDPTTTTEKDEGDPTTTTEKDEGNPTTTTEKDGENPDPSTTEGKGNGIMVKNNFWILILALPLLVLQH